MQIPTKVDSQTRTKLTAPEVIALGLVGLLALAALGSLLMVLAFI
jgi:hypothetical protein